MSTERDKDQEPLDLDHGTQDQPSAAPSDDETGSQPDEVSEEDQAILDSLKAGGLDDGEDSAESLPSETVENLDVPTDVEDVEDEGGDEALKDNEADEADAADAAGAADAADEDKANPIPYKRFQEVVRQKNVFKRDAETLRSIRETAKEAGWSEQATKEWLEFGFSFKDNPTSKAYRDTITAMAKVAGLAVVESLPSDLQSAVDDGQITPEYAEQLVASRITPDTEAKYTVPDLADQGYTQDQAQEDVNGVVNLYMEKHENILSKPEVQEEMKKAVLDEFNRLEKLTGYYPAYEKWGDITRRVLPDVVKRHRQPVVKPDREPLRSSEAARPGPKRIKSLVDIVTTGPMRKAFGD